MDIQKKYYYVQPIEKLNTFQRREEEINRNNIMTAYEKQTAKENLKMQKQAMYSQIVNALNTDWQVLKQEYQELKREKTAAVDRSEKKWDFQRLEYGRKSARDFLSRAGVEGIAKKYSDIELSGDTHALRGFVEEGLTILGGERKFNPEDLVSVQALLSDFRKMHEGLTVTKDMRDLAKQGEILTGKIRDVSQATDRAANEYFRIDAIATDPNPFHQMKKGVHVSQRVDNNLATITEVDLDWD